MGQLDAISVGQLDAISVGQLDAKKFSAVTREHIEPFPMHSLTFPKSFVSFAGRADEGRRGAARVQKAGWDAG